MNSRQFRALQSVSKSLVELKSDVGNFSPRIRVLVGELERSEERIRAFSVTQLGARSGTGAPRWLLRQAVNVLRRNHLIPIARDAKGLLKGYPGIADSVRVPHKTASAEQQLAAAERIRDAVAPHAREFVKAKYPRNFLVQLDRAAEAVRKAAANPASGRARYSSVTRDLRDELRHARELIARLDPWVRLERHDDPLGLSLWLRAKRIPARQGRPPKKRVKRTGGAALTALDRIGL